MYEQGNQLKQNKHTLVFYKTSRSRPIRLCGMESFPQMKHTQRALITRPNDSKSCHITLCRGGLFLPKVICRKWTKDTVNFLAKEEQIQTCHAKVSTVERCRGRQRGRDRDGGLSKSPGLTMWHGEPQLYIIGGFLVNEEL